jgi:hypothetical protein
MVGTSPAASPERTHAVLCRLIAVFESTIFMVEFTAISFFPASPQRSRAGFKLESSLAEFMLHFRSATESPAGEFNRLAIQWRP